MEPASLEAAKGHNVPLTRAPIEVLKTAGEQKERDQENAAIVKRKRTGESESGSRKPFEAVRHLLI